MEGPGTRYVLCQDRTAISKIKITWGCPGPAMAAEQMGPDVTFTPILEDLSQPRFPPPPRLPRKPGFHRNRWTVELSLSWNLTGKGRRKEKKGPRAQNTHQLLSHPMIQWGVTAAECRSQEPLPFQTGPSAEGAAHLCLPIWSELLPGHPTQGLKWRTSTSGTSNSP